jgi:hypothetical protein
VITGAVGAGTALAALPRIPLAPSGFEPGALAFTVGAGSAFEG